MWLSITGDMSITRGGGQPRKGLLQRLYQQWCCLSDDASADGCESPPESTRRTRSDVELSPKAEGRKVQRARRSPPCDLVTPKNSRPRVKFPSLSAPSRPPSLFSSRTATRRPRADTTYGLRAAGDSGMLATRKPNHLGNSLCCYPVVCCHCGRQFFSHVPHHSDLYGGEYHDSGNRSKRVYCGKNCKLTAALDLYDMAAALSLLTSPTSAGSLSYKSTCNDTSPQKKEGSSHRALS